ncbi:nuclear transport factor 2 family protein [Nocardioides kongjuensis]|uniref:Ketosteroid isomerase-like protein n=1 Tax=Nocardioides kongjuensis TaxID=349522 RepID=A0A852REL7_9ACTN|nr:nuclear transport factor 2 family protein [Nocardioides kongjuensis]NYD28869.1 ketosteroid isomerase-like protein [Nocardioides kongjuensis]
MPSTTLVRYYAAVDSGDLDTAMDLLAPDVRSAILLPGKAVRGTRREDLRSYLSGRGDVVRRHVPLRESVADDVEFVYGKVVEDERTTTGYFLASVRIDDAGLIAAYQVSFDTELSLLPDA